jgi:hypothetical protein
MVAPGDPVAEAQAALEKAQALVNTLEGKGRLKLEELAEAVASGNDALASLIRQEIREITEQQFPAAERALAEAEEASRSGQMLVCLKAQHQLEDLYYKTISEISDFLEKGETDKAKTQARLALDIAREFDKNNAEIVEQGGSQRSLTLSGSPQVTKFIEDVMKER